MYDFHMAGEMYVWGGSKLSTFLRGTIVYGSGRVVCRVGSNIGKSPQTSFFMFIYLKYAITQEYTKTTITCFFLPLAKFLFYRPMTLESIYRPDLPSHFFSGGIYIYENNVLVGEGVEGGGGTYKQLDYQIYNT